MCFYIQYRIGMGEIVDKINLNPKLRTEMPIVPACVVSWCQLCFHVTLEAREHSLRKEIQLCGSSHGIPLWGHVTSCNTVWEWDVHSQYLRNPWPCSLPLFNFSRSFGLWLSTHQFLLVILLTPSPKIKQTNKKIKFTSCSLYCLPSSRINMKIENTKCSGSVG